ncbi:unnamed protein product [Dicrocoelium dendriticum]|nr:unnamed protein product [Dicrocoelium dendriticum]
MFFNSHSLDVSHTFCNEIKEKIDQLVYVKILTGCRSEKVAQVGSLSIFEILLNLQLQPHHFLPSDIVYETIRAITDRINSASDHCTRVTKVVSNESNKGE